MVEALVCTSDWLRAEQPYFYKEPTVEELELYQEIEELEKGTDLKQFVHYCKIISFIEVFFFFIHLLY
jgi:hypothetical protein